MICAPLDWSHLPYWYRRLSIGDGLRLYNGSDNLTGILRSFWSPLNAIYLDPQTTSQ